MVGGEGVKVGKGGDGVLVRFELDEFDEMAEAESAGWRFGRRHRDRSAAGLVTQDSNWCVQQCVKGLNQRNKTDMHESQQRPLRSCPQDQESCRRRRDSRDYLMDGQISAVGLYLFDTISPPQGQSSKFNRHPYFKAEATGTTW